MKKRLVFALTLGLFAPDPVPAHPDLSVTIHWLGEVIRSDPAGAYKEREERGFLLLEEGDTSRVQEDIDVLMASPSWRPEGLHLFAHKRYNQGRFPEARARILESIRTSRKPDDGDKLRLLARIEVARRDTTASIDAWLRLWKLAGGEDDYMALLALYRARGKAPDKVLRQGVTQYADRAGAIRSIFDTYGTMRGTANLEACLRISAQAQGVWWPRSVDWKVRHARTLLALKRGHEAEPVLMAALDLLDEGPGGGRNEAAPIERREIFALLDSSRRMLR